ncbi:MAG: AAA family ATPase [Actinomycetota bacterium]
MTFDHNHSAMLAQRFDVLVNNVARVIQGKRDVIRDALVCLLAGGHLLIEDVPGTGKTSLARAIAASIELDWKRIQFTPDLLPSDVTGGLVYNQKRGEFEFRHGPIFANIVLADEINRASPKTQAALLEVMEEQTVTTDAIVYPVPKPFMVIATQNPIDMEGTYSLPEAQLDRFLMRIAVGELDPDSEILVLRTQKDGPTVEQIRPVMDAYDIAKLIEGTKQTEVSPAIEHYIVLVAGATRRAPEVRLGVSPRGSLALLRAARAAASAEGRPFVAPEDVKDMAPHVLTHRVLLHPEAALQGRTPADIVQRALDTVPIPRGAPR